MKRTDLIVLGSGNPDIIKLIEDINDKKRVYNFLGFLERDKNLHGNKIGEYEILGDDDLLKTKFNKCAVINNVSGTTKLRNELSNKIKTIYGITNFPNLIHPSVNTRYFNYGIGNIIYENVSLGADARIGDFNIFFYGSILAHEVNIGNYNLIGGNVMIGARSKIFDRVTLGNSSTISNNLSICDDAFVGVGSVVIKSILIPNIVFGNPARKTPS